MPHPSRIHNIDVLRGLVMIIMALDHTRDFIHLEALTGNPLDLQTTTPILYFTRWITHLCAPTFVFLSGTAAYMQSLRKSKTQLSGFLIKRGAWLILVEIIVVTFAITFDINYSFIILQVIWAIGISMVILGVMVRLPFYVILSVGVVIVAGHNVLDYYEASHKGGFAWYYDMLHRQSVFNIGSGRTLFNFYPFLPWVGVMLLGYCFGRFYLADVINRHRRTIILGASTLLFFVIARWLDVYGDPIKWSEQKNPLYTFLSFINTQKYPPSLLFLAVTLGISFISLGIMGDVRNRLTRIVAVYGQVPLFYYIIHFFLIHLISAGLYLARGHSFSEGLVGTSGIPFKFVEPGEGYSLLVVYLVWVGVVAFLYPFCKWYAAYKATHRNWWLSYL